MSGLHVAVDATSWHNRRGYGRHARALLRALLEIDRTNRYTFVTDVAGENGWPARADIRVVESRRPTATAAAADGARSLTDMWRISRALGDPAFDLLLFPTVYSFVPVRSRARKLLMIHDVIAERYPELTHPDPIARLFWRLKVAMGRRQADLLVTVSDYSREQMVEHFRLARERVRVVGEASAPIFRRLEQPALPGDLRELGLDERQRLVVYVGGFGPHKNLESLLRVFARLAHGAGNEDLRLVLVGEYRNEVFHSEYDALLATIERLGIGEQVCFTGFLPDEGLVALLNLAALLVLPSLMEGFGLPAVEAAACGCPVVATTESPLPALLGDGGRFVEPWDEGALEAAMAEILASEPLRARMRAAGLEAAARLTWDNAARQMLALIEEVGRP